MATSAKPWEVQDQSVGGGAASANAVPDTAPQEIIDPNDPRLISEAIEVNVEADAYAQPAPPPDGPRRLKLKLEPIDEKDAAPDGKGGKAPYIISQTKRAPIVPFYEVPFSGTILDPTGRFDGIKVYAPFGSTLATLPQKGGGSKAATVLFRLKKPDGTPWVVPGVRMNQLDWILLVIKALSGEPEIGAYLEWEASCRQCSDELRAKGQFAPTFRGMHRFPQETDVAKRKLGQQFDPEMACQANKAHGFMRARAVIKEFLHLHELPKVG